MSTASSRTKIVSSDSKSSLRWRSWPMHDSWLTALGVPALIVGVVLVMQWAGGRWLLSTAGALAIVVALWRCFVPTWYEIDGEGIWQSVFGWYGHMPWSRVRRQEVGRGGVMLLPDNDPSPLIYVRGVYVPFCGRREEILTAIYRCQEGDDDDRQ